MYLDASAATLSQSGVDKAGKVTYRGLSEGVTFLTQPLDQDTEITGQLAAKLFVSSSTVDADMFLIMRIFDPNMKEVTFQGALDPNTPIAQGWLRASHRELDPNLSEPYRPYHPHTKKE